MVRARDDSPTLTDRLALAFLSGAAGLLLSGGIWITVCLLFAFEPPFAFAPFAWIIGFACLMAAIGFLAMENLVVTVVGKLIEWLGSLLHWSRLP